VGGTRSSRWRVTLSACASGRQVSSISDPKILTVDFVTWRYSGTGFLQVFLWYSALVTGLRMKLLFAAGGRCRRFAVGSHLYDKHWDSLPLLPRFTTRARIHVIYYPALGDASRTVRNHHLTNSPLQRCRLSKPPAHWLSTVCIIQSSACK
jgi:hypothetical protein